MLLLLPVLLAAGLFAPGYFAAKYLCQSGPSDRVGNRVGIWAGAFPLSLVILFHGIFWLGILHAPITLVSVLPYLIAVMALAAWLGRSATSAAAPDKPARWDALDRILLLASAFVGAILLARLAITPLIGYDTRFRWDFLAQKMLALARFDFYPPLTPTDFKTYFYVDGIPPMISFTHWWMYASAGEYLPRLIALFAAAQFVCTLAFTYGAASVIYSRRAGVLAAALLAGCPMYFKAVVIGQETGLTALAIAAMIYFIVTAKERDVRGLAAAGIAAGLCALSREYGWMAVIAGFAALLWRRQPPRQILIFGAVAATAAGPWYLRNWVIAGNPFYSLRFFGFAVNPIHDGIMQAYGATLGVTHWDGAKWREAIGLMISLAAVPVFAGVAGGVARFRRDGYLLATALLFAAAWLLSVGSTSGGLAISTRVLSPAMVALCILGAGAIEPFTARREIRLGIVGALVVCTLWTAAHGVLYPISPGRLPLRFWPDRSFQNVGAPPEFQARDRLLPVLPPGKRILSENAHLHAALAEEGVEVVPVWSPEVSFLYSASPEEAARRLNSLGIGVIGLYPDSLNTTYLVSASPFYKSLPHGWRVQANVQQSLYFLVPE